MSPDKCLVVVVEDRHCDVDVKVFVGSGALPRALHAASEISLVMAGGRLEDVSLGLNRAQEQAGYLWFAAVGPEGDCVRVQEISIDCG